MWKDSRIHKPNSNYANIYAVKFHHIKHCQDLVSNGYATWMPKNNYTDGDWIDVTCTNGNPQSECEVLFWHEFLEFEFKI